MNNLSNLWKNTKNKFKMQEKALIENYILFLRRVARKYTNEGRKVFFKANKVVHWGEGGFGKLIIEGDEASEQIFGDYIAEISFKHLFDEKTIKGFTKINSNNINAIKYES